MIALDTSTIILAINRRVRGVRERLERTIAEGMMVGVSAIALYGFGTASARATVRTPTPARWRCSWS